MTQEIFKLERTRVLMLFYPNTDMEQKRELLVVCALLCTQKQKERRIEYNPVFVVHAAAALVTSVFHATTPCLLLLAAAFLHHCDWILSALIIQFLSGHLR